MHMRKSIAIDVSTLAGMGLCIVNGAWKDKKGQEIFVDPDTPPKHSQGNLPVFSTNEDSLIIRLRDLLRGMSTLKFLVAKERLTALADSQCMLKNLVNCMDTRVETMENLFVGTNNFLAQLGIKATILEITTIQKFTEVNARIGTLHATLNKVLLSLAKLAKDLRLPASKSGSSCPPSKKHAPPLWL